MSGGITLHPEHGVNAKLTFCHRCGGESQELILLGDKDYKFKCGECSTTSFGNKSCLKCKSRTGKTEKIDEHERLPSMEPCSTCLEEMRLHESIVDAGGVYFKCDGEHRGVIKPNEFTAEVRNRLQIPTGPCGVHLSKEQCPECNKSSSSDQDSPPSSSDSPS